MKWLKHLLLISVLTAAVLSAIEGCSLAALWFADAPVAPFLFDRKGFSAPRAFQQNFGRDLVVSYVDPHLGFAHDPKTHPLFGGIEGFAVYKNGDAAGDSLVVVCLGGSTTDPVTPILLDDPAVNRDDPYNWPRSLAKLLASHGVPATVYNGGVAGYTSNQELLKLVRDVLSLKPDIVVVLDGVNEFSGHTTPLHPMVHPYQASLMNHLSSQANPPLMPNTITFFRRMVTSPQRSVTGVTLGHEVATTSVEQWIRNIVLEDAVCKATNARFLCILQPILGFGEYNPSPKEQTGLSSRGEKYLNDLRSFYAGATDQCRKFDFCIDLTNVFVQEDSVYIDPRHQNEKGVDSLARAVYRQLEAKGLLSE